MPCRVPHAACRMSTSMMPSCNHGVALPPLVQTFRWARQRTKAASGEFMYPPLPWFRLSGGRIRGPRRPAACSSCATRILTRAGPSRSLYPPFSRISGVLGDLRCVGEKGGGGGEGREDLSGAHEDLRAGPMPYISSPSPQYVAIQLPCCHQSHHLGTGGFGTGGSLRHSLIPHRCIRAPVSSDDNCLLSTSPMQLVWDRVV